MTPTESTNLVNTRLNDRYLIESVLGEGGMGVVYRAQDTLIERQVAIKVTSSAYLGTEGRTRLVVEARAAGALNHPNIVTIFDIGGANDQTFIVMEFVEGQTLAAHKPGSLEETIEITKHICAALMHAHEKGIIHRDLKPENVMLPPDGTLKLMDFGLARSVSSRLTKEGQLVGTVMYMSPEQAMGAKLDGRTDLYSLGVMLYELTTGQLPFQADDPFAIITQHLHAPPVPPIAHQEDLPGYLNNLILKLLEKEPQKRLQSAAVVLETLDAPQKAEADLRESKELTDLDRIVRGRIVGRRAEYEKARSLWKEAIKGQGQILLISGEPGIGKTRLTREVITQAEVGRGQAYLGEAYAESNTPYGAFAQITRTVFKRNPNIARELPQLVLADILKLVPTLKHQYPDIEPNLHLDPESEQALLLENMVIFFEVLCGSSPLLIVLDDIHWADSGTLTMFHYLIRRTQDQPVMFLATFREIDLRETQPFNELLLELNRQRVGERTKLERLNKEQTHQMLSAIFQEDITEDFLTGIHQESDGNPFFIEEISRALVESGKLRFEDGEWHRPSIEELELPQGIQATIESRLYKLEEQVQESLRMAAVLGREFEFDILRQALEFDEDALIEALEIAEAAQMIEELAGRGDISFAFVHALVPQSIRASIRSLRRRKLHIRAAAAYETQQPGNYEALAYHYGEGGSDEKALQFYILAAQRAVDNYANQDAENLLLHALDLANEPQKRAELYQNLGRVLTRLNRTKESIEAYREGIKIYQELNDLDSVAKLYALAVRSTPPDFLALAQEGIKAVEGLQEGPGLAHLLERMASAYIFSGKMDEGLPFGQRALEMAEKFNISAVQVEALNTLSIAVSREDRQEGLNLCQQAIDLAEQNNLWRGAMRAHYNFANLNDDNRAVQIKHYDRAIELARMIGLSYQEISMWTGSISFAVWMGDLGYGLQELPKIKARLKKVVDLGLLIADVSYLEGDIYRFLGDLESALPKYLHALKIYDENERKLGMSNTIGATAWLLIEMGLPEHLDQAHDLLQIAIEIEPTHAIYLALFVPLFIRKGDLAEAQNYLNKAQGAYQENPDPWAQYWIFLTKSQLLTANQEWNEAWAEYDNTIELPVLMEYPWFKADTLKQWAEAHLARGEAGDRSRARELLEESLTMFEDIGATGYVEKVEAQLEELA